MGVQDLSVEPSVDDSEITIANTTASGAPPAMRLKTAEAAALLYLKLHDEYGTVAGNRARIQGMYDGNPPWNPSELERLGQSYRCNVNYRELESIIDANTAAAWSLHMDVGTLIESKFAPKYRSADFQVDDWAQIIDMEYSRALMNWNGFFSNLNLSLHEYFMFGLGGALWPDEWDWRSKAVKSGNLLVPPLASTDIDKVDLLFVRDRMELGDVYRAIEDRKAAKARGWNVALVKRLLVYKYMGDGAAPQDDATQTSVWESMQEKIRVGDPAIQSKEFEGVEVIHVLVREVSGERKVSHLILADDDKYRNEDFLYVSRQKYGSMANVAWLLPYSYGDGYLRSSKGLGHRSMPHCEFSNRFLCNTFDAGMLASSLLVQPKTGLDASRMALIRMGPITLLPESLAVVQSQFMPNLGNLISLRGLSKDILHNNTGVFRPRNELTSANEAPKTAQQVRSEENREARFERNQVEHFYTHWQQWHKETFRRLTRKDYINSSLDLPGLKEAKEFVQRCVDQGVPKELLLDPDAIEIQVARAIGMGSPSVKMDITNQLQAMKGSMDEQGRKSADREWGAVRVGYWNVDKFFNKGNRDSIPSNAQSFAVLENNSMADGREVSVGSDQTHVIHAATHFARAQQMVQAFQGGQMDPIQAVQEMGMLLNHTTIHIQYLSRDITRKAQVQKLTQLMDSFIVAFKQMQAVAAKVIKAQQAQAAEAEDQAAQQAPQMDPETQVKMAEIQKDYELEVMKQESLNRARAEKTQTQGLIHKGTADFNNLLAAQKAQAEIEIKRQLTDAEIESKRAKSAQP
jgi:hypothetical protein